MTTLLFFITSVNLSVTLSEGNSIFDQRKRKEIIQYFINGTDLCSDFFTFCLNDTYWIFDNVSDEKISDK